jgi:hypothetical protein
MQQTGKSSEFWKRMINVYSESNLSKANFCNENKLHKEQFYYWCNKLRPDLKTLPNTNKSNSSLFLPVKTSQKEKIFSIILTNGMKISFDSLPDPSWIASLIISVDNLYVKH